MAQTVDHTPDASPMDRAGAHRTGFATGVHCEILKLGSVPFSAEHSHKIGFSVSGDVALGIYCVFRFEQYLAILVGKNGAKRMIACSRGFAGYLKGSSKQFCIPRAKLVSHLD